VVAVGFCPNAHSKKQEWGAFLTQRSRWPQPKENHPQIAQMYADKECKAAMISSLSSYPLNLRHLRIDFRQIFAARQEIE
jgi:hypothetical protein